MFDIIASWSWNDIYWCIRRHEILWPFLTAIFTLVLALVAIFANRKTAQIASASAALEKQMLDATIDNFKRSVVPLVRLHLETNDDEKKHSMKITYSLRNTGVGPAVIRGITYFLNENPFPEAADRSDTIKNLIKICFGVFSGECVDLHTETPALGGAILAGGELVLATIKFKFNMPHPVNYEITDALMKSSYESQKYDIKVMADQLDIRVEHDSLYEPQKPFDTRDDKRKRLQPRTKVSV